MGVFFVTKSYFTENQSFARYSPKYKMVFEAILQDSHCSISQYCPSSPLLASALLNKIPIPAYYSTVPHIPCLHVHYYTFQEQTLCSVNKYIHT